MKETLKKTDQLLYSDANSAKKLADIHLCETTGLKPFTLYNGTRYCKTSLFLFSSSLQSFLHFYFDEVTLKLYEIIAQ